MKKRKNRGIETLKARYGLIFISPWVIGILAFFIFPIFQSVYFSFSKLRIEQDGVSAKFTGLDNIKHALFVDADYVNNLLEAIKELFVSLPFILVISLILALLLNGEFKGRLFFRSLYFFPVILASGIVLELFMKAAYTNATEVALSDSISFSMIDFSEILRYLDLSPAIETYLSDALGNMFMLIWQSGIQIILFIAGLQSIPDLLYEVSKVEGATKWEEFWFITLPMLLRTMLLVIIFTTVEIITQKTNPVIAQSYNLFSNLEYGRGSAMLWLYFVIIGIFIAVFFLIYNKVFMKKWG